MIQMLLICTLMTQANDTIPKIETSAKKGYGKQVLINGIIGIGFTVGTAIFYTKGNSAYSAYEASQTMTGASENWDKTMLYDNLRNVCAVGTLVFLTRALYYQFKGVRTVSATSRYSPVINLQYACRPKVMIGFSRHF